MDLEKIKKKLRPDEKPIRKKVDEILKKLNKEIKAKKISAEAVAGGSIAKGTFIKGDYDVDIFVKFSKKYKTDKLADLLEKCIKKFRPERLHGSRDYFQIKVGRLIFEIVPVYNINSADEVVNITDASPLHFRWVREQLEKNPHLADEIRLAKAFCKAQEIYGAESYIRGFSGHVLDIITIYYSSFTNLLKNASRWKEKQVIDFYDVYKGNALKKLNRSKTESPLIVIDPVQPERNASASLSTEIFNKFIAESKHFISKPSEKFFEKEKFSLSKIKKKKAIIIQAAALKGKRDVVGSKLLKAFEKIKTQLKKNGFELKESGWKWNGSAYYWFVFKSKNIPKTYTREGPPVNAKKNAENFKEKHKSTFVKSKRLYAKVEREFTDAKKCLSAVIKSEFLKEYYKSARILK
ncbi:CCA tRNA nucleotidyltransferase [Candidatus Woesearchaeota archaeon]|nr:CCA tRNA nucleotidyltransferase [Candidatus Woesearchaeota archaeon]